MTHHFAYESEGVWRETIDGERASCGAITHTLHGSLSSNSSTALTSERSQLERVLNDDIQPVDVIAALAAVGAMGDMGQLQRQVLGRA